MQVGGSRWFNLLWLLPIGFVLLIVGDRVDEDARPEDALPLEGMPLIPEPGLSFVGIRTSTLTSRRFPLRT